MRILQIVKYYYPAMTFGGPVRCVYNLSKYLASKGHHVTVLTTDALDIDTNIRIKERYAVSENVEVFRFPNLSRFFGWFITPTVFQKLGLNIKEFDIVHLHEYRTFQNMSFYFTNFLKKPYVITPHGQLFTAYVGDSINNILLRNAFDPIFGRRLLKGASRVLALTKSEASRCVQFGANIDAVSTIPNGINLDDFLSIPNKNEFKSRFGITEENIILYIGRINKRKGIDILINACSKLFLKHNNIKLVIAGADDGYLGDAIKLVRSLKLESKILFTESLSRRQVLAAYNDATIVVCAGIQEGLPIVLLEAGLMGKPVIVSNDSAVDFVRKGKFGLTVEYGNESQLAQALETLLNNRVLLKDLSKNGKEFISKNYSWETVGKKIEAIYSDIVN